MVKEKHTQPHCSVYSGWGGVKLSFNSKSSPEMQQDFRFTKLNMRKPAVAMGLQRGSAICHCF